MQGSIPGSAPILEGFSSKQRGYFVDGEPQFPRKGLPLGRGMWNHQHKVC